MASTTPIRTMRAKAQTSRICTILPSVRSIVSHVQLISESLIAKKDDNPEQALKEFRTIVDQEEEKGDWYASGFTSTEFDS